MTARPKVIPLQAEIVDQYAGQYLLHPNTRAPMATIAREGGHLAVSFPFRPEPLTLEPISETGFDMPDTDGRFTFINAPAVASAASGSGSATASGT